MRDSAAQRLVASWEADPRTTVTNGWRPEPTATPTHGRALWLCTGCGQSQGGRLFETLSAGTLSS
jgi:hypothetical protein